MKMVLLIACVGHVLCGICDCLLGYSPSGRLDLKSALKDPVKMRTTFEDMPLKWPLISIILGVYAITAFGFGYLGLSRWMEDYSKIASVIMYISAVFFLISIVVHHIICGLVEWLYVRMGRTDEARTVALEFQMKTIATMFVGYLGLVIYVITLFVCFYCRLQNCRQKVILQEQLCIWDYLFSCKCLPIKEIAEEEPFDLQMMCPV